MTLTELEKLEALHAAAPPGEWAAERAERVIALGEALHSAFPAMAKALREAWDALDEVGSDYRMSEAQIIATITAFQKERDDARAEATRLREQVDWLLEGRRQEEQRLALEIDERELP